jgi:signal transduction histidine kinase
MRISLSTKVALGTFISAGVGVLLISLLSYTLMSNYFKQNTLNSLKHEMQQDVKSIKENIDGVYYNINILSKNENLKVLERAFLSPQKFDIGTNTPYETAQDRVIQSFKALLAYNDSYYKIRLIYRNGQELISVVKDFDNNVIYTDRESSLLNQSKRKFFQESIKLHKNDLYISDINLNKEDTDIASSPIPTIRISVPLYSNNKIFAILVINANINILFVPLHEHSGFVKNIYLANQAGYYLYHPDEKKTFGFQRNKEYKITKDFNLSQEHYFKEDLLFIHTKIYLSNSRYLILALTTSNEFFKKQSREYEYTLGIYILIITFVVAFVTLSVVRYLISPIQRLTQKAKMIAANPQGKGFDEIKTHDEIEDLSRSLQSMLNELNRSKREIEKKVEERTKELHTLNANLEKSVLEKTKENMKQLEILQQQNKLASMGEMIGAIAHQWRQPLNELSIAIQNIKYDFDDGLVDKKYIENFITETKKIIMFMSHTIDDFRNFYRIDKTEESFDVKEAIEKSVFMQKAQLKNHNIDIEINGESFTIKGYKNEFQQAILNIINNAKDILVEKEVPNAKISIELTNNTVKISDNGGGVPLEIIERIFEPYFTTKEEGKGTGMGLYMSKMILEENMHAKFSVRNRDNGSEFRIDFNDTK